MRKGPERIPTAARMFEPFLERAVAFLEPARQPYGIEGEVITPETAARLRSDYDLRVVFLIRSSPTAADITDSRGPNPWLAAAGRDVVASVTAEVHSWSIHVEASCRQLAMPCFDVSGDFERAMADAAAVLTADIRPD
jgi:hypothetical protein